MTLRALSGSSQKAGCPDASSSSAISSRAAACDARSEPPAEPRAATTGRVTPSPIPAAERAAEAMFGEATFDKSDDEKPAFEDAPSNPWDAAPDGEQSARARFATRASFMINVLLCLIKYVAFIYSRSYVVLASAVDSTMDLVSGGVLFCQARAAARQDRPKVRDKFPTGLSRL